MSTGMKREKTDTELKIKEVSFCLSGQDGLGGEDGLSSEEWMK
jgi:hypothetical protein